MKENNLYNKAFEFSCDVLDLYVSLKDLHYYEVANQLIRSGTSIGANIKEAQRAESDKDFVHKLQIALKEADETEYWLALIDKKITTVSEEMMSKNEELIKILVTIIKKVKIRIGKI